MMSISQPCWLNGVRMGDISKVDGSVGLLAAILAVQQLAPKLYVLVIDLVIDLVQSFICLQEFIHYDLAFVCLVTVVIDLLC